jgi:hypothetical protein
VEQPKYRSRQVACYKCRYYQVTWDARQPYGCRAHGFKTSRNPSEIVFETSGIECQLFKPKIRKSSRGRQ